MNFVIKAVMDPIRAPREPFIYYVSKFLGFLKPPYTYVSLFLVLKVSKICPFLTHTPQSLPLKSGYVIYEWYLGPQNQSIW